MRRAAKTPVALSFAWVRSYLFDALPAARGLVREELVVAARVDDLARRVVPQHLRDLRAAQRALRARREQLLAAEEAEAAVAARLRERGSK